MSSDLRSMWEAAGGRVPKNWRFQTIESLLEHQKSIAVGVMSPGSDTADGVPLIKVSDIKNGEVQGKPSFCISREVDEEYKRTRLYGDELLITLVGEPGDCAIATDEMAGWNAARAVAVVKLKNPDLRHWLRQMPRDDYEQLAATAALFPDAMKDSELEEIPKEWAVGALSDLCHLNPESWSAKTLPDTVRYVDLANAKRGEISEIQNLGGKDIPSRARRILRHGDTVIGTVRPGNRSFALIGENGLTGSTGFAVLRPKASYWLEFVYLVATSEANIERLAHLADGGAYPAVRPEVVVHERVAVPTVSIAQAFNQYMQPLFSKLLANRKDAILLADLRDTLLPQLLSGELSVADIHQEVAA